jgi:hypothetical protein
MNRFTMALQAFIVVCLLGIVLVIGYSKQDKGYIEYTRGLRSACIQYMKDKNINPKIGETNIIFVSDLLDEEYIDEVKEEYCIVSVIHRQGLLFGKYKANKDCTIKIETNETNQTIEENNTKEE